MMEDLSLLQSNYPTTVTLLGLILGLCIGSVLNVVIVRLPIILKRQWVTEAYEILDLKSPPGNGGITLSQPCSHCPKCKAHIRPWDNIPVISYLRLFGKCASCGAKIPSRYLIIELTTGGLTAFIIYSLGITYSGLFGCFFTWGLITLSFIDHDTNILPDGITLPFLWLGLVANYFELFIDFRSAFIGVCLGYCFLWSTYQIHKFLTGKDGMGHGDFKLLALIGAWLGWQPLFLVVFLASIGGLIFTTVRSLSGKKNVYAIAFGPYLACSGWIMMFWGDVIMNHYLALIGII